MGSFVGDYLRARRALVRPEDVGIASGPGWRRVQGLRREELAAVAGLSPEYYTRLEQGQHAQPSAQVLQSLARPLGLDHYGLAHLLRLSRIDSGAERAESTHEKSDNALALSRQLITYFGDTGALVVDNNQDVVLCSPLAASLGQTALRPGVNLLEVVYASWYRLRAPGWLNIAHWSTAALRYHGHPRDPRFRSIVARMKNLGGTDFDRLWARHDVAPFGPVTAGLRLGEARWTLTYVQGLEIHGAPGLHLLVSGPRTDEGTAYLDRPSTEPAPIAA